MVNTRNVNRVPRCMPALLCLAFACQLAWLTGCVESRGPRGVTGWFVSDLRELTPDSTASPENEIYSATRNEIVLQAAVNETLGLQSALRSESSGRFRVELSDLNGPAGNIAAADTVTIYRILPVNIERFQAWYSDHAGRPALPHAVPDILVPLSAPRNGGPAALDDRHNELVWIDLHVPSGAGPGDYTGEFRVIPVGAAQPAWTVPIRLRVLPISLPAEPQLTAIARLDPRDLLSEHLKWPATSAEESALLPAERSHAPAIQLVNAAMAMLHEHRLNPVLWGGFPKYRMSGERAVEIDWTNYDVLVAGWLDGSAFPDKVGVSAWPMPVSENYPSAERNGGFSSPRYARVLGAYVAECRKHFTQLKWNDKAFARICDPAPLTQESVEHVRRAVSILRQNEVTTPLIAHLPIQSLRALGWFDAPHIDLPEIRIWAPPARWCEPLALQRELGLGKRVWFMPDYAPYAGSLAVEAPPTDAAILGWMAYRYNADGLWIENAGEFRAHPASSSAVLQGAALIYPGTLAGLGDRPLPSVRLKRLRRGLQDYDLLHLLDAAGKPLLARRTSEQLVRWAFLDACTDNLLTGRPTGFSDNAYALHLARKLLRQELANQGDSSEQTAALTDWARLLADNPAVVPEVRGVRITSLGNETRAIAYLRVSNGSDKPLSSRVQTPQLPVGWKVTEDAQLSADPRGVANGRLAFQMSNISTNADGVAQFSAMLNSVEGGSLPFSGRLAVSACPFVDKPPVLDGDLSDWTMAASNAAGDFRLVRGRGVATAAGRSDAPAAPTQIFFCIDRGNLYVAAICALEPGKQPIWRPNNLITTDGNIPWGQELVEVLLDPREPGAGSPADMFVLQVKPSGLVLSRKGCPTDPPTAPVVEWQSGARVAIGTRPDAWLMELSLPLSSLGAGVEKTRVWGINVTRFDAQHAEYSSWSGARQNCYSPELLGNLIVPGP